MSAIAKNIQFINIIIGIGIFFIPTYSFAQSIGVTGQFGAIFLTSMRDEDAASSWGINGIVHSGGIISSERSFLLSDISKEFEDYLIPYEAGLEFTYVEMKKATPKHMLETTSQLFATMLSIRAFNKDKYYLMFGIGRTWLYGYASIGILSGDITAEDWAFQVGIGKDSAKDLRFEVKYLYGARNGNTGVIVGIGTKLYLF